MEALPLTALFVDCDAYFASVEQHLDPSLRGRPVAVAPVMAETSCCIAASYEAKAFGVSTGTRIADARKLCPGIAIVPSKPEEYIRHHHRIVAAVEDCIHVEAVLSIDEMWAWLPFNRRDPDIVRGIAQHIKETIARDVSPFIKVSIGVGPNRYLAKTASKMRKPDGLFFIHHADLPEALHELALSDLHGVGRRMEARLHAAGIHTARDLCAAPKPLLRHVWNGVTGERLWHLLRGEEIPDRVETKKSIGHSHVLPPESRTPDRAWPVLCKLLHKACERLRAHGLLASSLTLHLAYLRRSRWQTEAVIPESDSTLVWMRLLGSLWKTRPDPDAQLIQVAVTLTRLVEHSNFTPTLFPGMLNDGPSSGFPSPAVLNDSAEEKHRRLDHTLDRLRARYGRRTVYLGSVQDVRQDAPMRISFTHIPDPRLEGDD
jgi:DNA polymerase-4